MHKGHLEALSCLQPASTRVTGSLPTVGVCLFRPIYQRQTSSPSERVEPSPPTTSAPLLGLRGACYLPAAEWQSPSPGVWVPFVTIFIRLVAEFHFGVCLFICSDKKKSTSADSWFRVGGHHYPVWSRSCRDLRFRVIKRVFPSIGGIGMQHPNYPQCIISSRLI